MNKKITMIFGSQADALNVAGRLIAAHAAFDMAPMSENRWAFTIDADHRTTAEARNDQGFILDLAAVNIDDSADPDPSYPIPVRITFAATGVLVEYEQERDHSVLVENYIKDGEQQLRVLAWCEDDVSDDPSTVAVIQRFAIPA
ncbi:MAG: hypothetical protein HC828_01595 [Blastochloris sp.]|nr:hypothetical protein [Blastochloris sp.]